MNNEVFTAILFTLIAVLALGFLKFVFLDWLDGMIEQRMGVTKVRERILKLECDLLEIKSLLKGRNRQ